MTFSQIISGAVVLACAFQSASATRALHGAYGEDCEDDTCMELFEKCGGTNMTVSAPCCDTDTFCFVKNYFYAQCLTQELADANVARGDWDGTILGECMEMPMDVLKAPVPEEVEEDDTEAPSRRLLQETMEPFGGYGEMDCEDEMCSEMFEKCGGGWNLTTTCCDPDTQCTVKNWFYAQCLTEERAARNVAEQGWDGRVLMGCEEMPGDAPKGPAFWTHDWMPEEEDVEE